MKTISWMGLFAAIAWPAVGVLAQTPEGPVAGPGPNNQFESPATPAAPTDISPAAGEVIRLAEAGSGDDVVLAYIRNSQAPFSLSADHILYLKDLGISSAVLSAMLTHDTTIRIPGPVTAPPPQQEPVTAPLTPPAQQEPVYANPPEEVSYFYNDLAPYGAWVQLDGGWCWQPSAVVINRSWSPYCNGGHWVYSDCGWYWASDYSWGWAPFHYGRWQLHDRCGWVWRPDRVWGPAWVTWRYSGDRCGWAPLPPHSHFDGHGGMRYNGVSVGVNFDFGLRPDHFTFVSMHDFADRDLGRHRLAHTEVNNVFRQTTVVNNFSVVNNRVVNQGLPVDRVSAATHHEFHRATVRDLPAQPGAGPGRVHSTDRDSSVVYRTQLRTPARTPAVAVQKVDSRNPVIQHQPTVPARVDYRNTGRGGSPYSVAPSSPTSPRRYETPGSSAPRRNENGPSYPQNRQEPRNYPSAPLAPSAPSAPPANRNESGRPSASVTTPRQYQQSQAYNTHQANPRQSYEGRVQSSSGNSHVYYPKTYHQSSETRPAPQSAAQNAPRRETSSAPPASRGNSSSSGNSDRGSKHDR